MWFVDPKKKKEVNLAACKNSQFSNLNQLDENLLSVALGEWQNA
jgi:hypothetical protein